MDKRTQRMTLETEVRLRGFAFYQRTMCYHLFSLEDVEMFLSVHVKLIFSLFCFLLLLFLSPPHPALFSFVLLFTMHISKLWRICWRTRRKTLTEMTRYLSVPLSNMYFNTDVYLILKFSLKCNAFKNAVVLTFDSNTNRSLFFCFVFYCHHIYIVKVHRG